MGEKIFYVRAANGMTARVPESKLESWSKRQKEYKEGKAEPNPETVKQLTSLLENKIKEITLEPTKSQRVKLMQLQEVYEVSGEVTIQFM